jgi:protein-S-isoprenylcysteine O-methyltransferase Ste14
LGLALVFRYQVLLWFALYLFLAFWLASYFEEAELVQRFGQAYVDYRKNVPRFFVRFRLR